jgi:hypothetical protein
MKNVLSLLLVISLSACSPQIKYVFPDAPPPPPRISDEIRKACPGLKALSDRSISTLVETMKSDSYTYAKCKAGFKAALEINDLTYEQYTKWITAYEKAKKDAKK